MSPKESITQDPVCGMSVDRSGSSLSSLYRGEQHYFCAPQCKSLFDQSPEKFSSTSVGQHQQSSGLVSIELSSKRPKKQSLMNDTNATQIEIIVNGMHCASCVSSIEGALNEIEGVFFASVNLVTERVSVSCNSTHVSKKIISDAIKEAGPYKVSEFVKSGSAMGQQRNMDTVQLLTRRVVVAVGLSGFIMLTSMAPTRLFSMAGMSPNVMPFVSFVMASVVLFWCGQQFFQRALGTLKRLSFDMDSLIALGAGTAFFHSSIAIFGSGELFKAVAERGLYFDTASMIVTIVLIGRLLEARAKHRASSSVQKLMTLSPETAYIVDGVSDGSERQVDVSSVSCGDIIHVRPGERIPVDGVVRTGETTIDESMLTGESSSVHKVPGDEVTAGTLNQLGAFRFEAMKVGSDTVLARIIKLVQDAQTSKAPVQRIADKVASILVPVVLGTAALTFVVWVIADSGLPFALEKAIAVMIVACPCSVGLATPTAIVVATGKGATRGILFKTAESLELLSRVHRIILDKTGTLTEGNFRVTDVFAHGPSNATRVISMAAAGEYNSEHPIGRAIVDYATSKAIRTKVPNEFKMYPGKGVRAILDDDIVLVGNSRLMKENFLDVSGLQTQADELTKSGKNPVFVAINSELIGVLGVADAIKESAPRAVAEMADSGLHPTMLTGDNHIAASRVAQVVGISEIHAGVLPESKASIVEKLQSSGSLVAMVGDGINDAPALAKADIGIAVHGGTDIAIDASDVTLIRGGLTSVMDAVRLSKKTMRIIRQNLFWAFFYNGISIPIAAGVFYNTYGLALSPVLAAGAMACSSVSVILNALRIKSY